MSMAVIPPAHGRAGKEKATQEEPLIKPEEKKETRVLVEPAKSSRSTCRRCKDTIDRGETRIGIMAPSRYSGETPAYDTTWWFHVPCFITRQLRSREYTPKVRETSDLEGFDDLDPKERHKLEQTLKDFNRQYAERLERRRARRGRLTSDEEEEDESEEIEQKLEEEVQSHRAERRARHAK
ncbi:hypothetical protein PTSG_10946 [Salpingoeca rosetta]|uniref:PARP-type domain-containing protein n=1 Tax=Salpingoeca rosetta (strain ATCC 50818 / BSB-021) TaxID=946362 RepID=F2US93_SALR5|nr:uncharacterized protein PTSG_10946 [Salpingoeca rosetta]EGD81002.1 hypothetical protein PTSG_10946 [Salpingoeca rosetta]|eukprot:XP_004987872.1 hypothetical protein PTSG_10946 [Salpingoeca rosetta]